MIAEIARRSWIPDGIRQEVERRRREASIDSPSRRQLEHLWPDGLIKKNIGASIDEFAARTRQADLFERVRAEMHDTDLEPDKFSLSANVGIRGSVKEKNMYSDTMYGFFLEYDTQNLAYVGFSILDRYNKENLERRGISSNTLQLNDLIIIQLQSKQSDKSFFSGFRWEFVLLGLVCSWAQEVGFPRILLQPSANNNWVSAKTITSFKLRYDVTARRYGFSRDREDAPYALDLRQSQA